MNRKCQSSLRLTKKKKRKYLLPHVSRAPRQTSKSPSRKQTKFLPFQLSIRALSRAEEENYRKTFFQCKNCLRPMITIFRQIQKLFPGTEHRGENIKCRRSLQCWTTNKIKSKFYRRQKKDQIKETCKRASSRSWICNVMARKVYRRVDPMKFQYIRFNVYCCRRFISDFKILLDAQGRNNK